MCSSNSKIFIGPAGWSYPDWNGIVYPHKRLKGFSELEYIAKYFNVVEINSSFYKIPSQETVEKWRNIKNINPEFKFLVKLWQNFTHSFPYKNKDSVAQFIDAFSPMEQDIFGGLLIQFPWRFKHSAGNVEYLEYLFSTFLQFKLCIEFRHNSWNILPVLSLLKKYNVTFVNIDQPTVSNSISLTNNITSNMAYIRLHGRNTKEWFNEQGGRDSRYNYLYEKEELKEWVPFINNEKSVDEVFVIFNNHFRGQAVVNALQMLNMLFQNKPKAPSTLLRSNPGIEKFVLCDDLGETLPLF